eukprot:353254-Amphidinium_carterae.1
MADAALKVPPQSVESMPLAKVTLVSLGAVRDATGKEREYDNLEVLDQWSGSLPWKLMHVRGRCLNYVLWTIWKAHIQVYGLTRAHVDDSGIGTRLEVLNVLSDALH